MIILQGSTTVIDLPIRNDDGTPAESISFTAGDLRVRKGSGTWANVTNGTPTHTEDGVWDFTPTATETNTVGQLRIKFRKTGYATLIRTVEVELARPGVVAEVNDNAIDSDALAGSAVTEIQSGLATSAGVTSAVAPLATSAGLTSAVAPLATAAGLASAVAPLATSAGLTSAVSPLATTAGLASAVDPLATTAELTSAVADLATAAEVTSAVAPLATAAGLTSAVSPLATSAGVTSAVAPLATAAGLTSAVAPLATATGVSNVQTAIIAALAAGVPVASLASGAISAIWDHVIEGAFTARGFLRLFGSVLLWPASGLEGASPTFRDQANTKNRIVTGYVSGTRTVVGTPDQA